MRIKTFLIKDNETLTSIPRSEGNFTIHAVGFNPGITPSNVTGIASYPVGKGVFESFWLN